MPAGAAPRAGPPLRGRLSRLLKRVPCGVGAHSRPHTHLNAESSNQHCIRKSVEVSDGETSRLAITARLNLTLRCVQE